MNKNLIWMMSLIALIAAANFPGTASAEDKSNAEVKAAADQFYVALNAMFTGDSKPMEDVWLHSDNTVYMGPDGTLVVGWDKIKEVWEFQAGKKMGGKVTASEMHITSGHHMGVTYNYEIGENFDADGNPVKVSIRATNIFHKTEDGEWKMIGHHTDLLPFLVNNDTE